MNKMDIVAQSNQDTVVAEYVPGVKKASGYQSEATLEKEFISRLEKQGYAFLKICSEQELINNLRKQLEKLNQHAFSDSEWERFFDNCIADKNDGILEKTKKIQEDYIQVLTRDDSTIKNM